MNSDIMELKKLSQLMAKETATPELAAFLLKRDITLANELSIRPNLSLNFFSNNEKESLYLHLIARSSKSKAELQLLKDSNFTSYIESFILNPNLSLSYRLSQLDFAYQNGLTIDPKSLFSFLAKNYSLLGDTELERLVTIFQVYTTADDFVAHYRDVLLQQSIEEVAIFFQQLSYFSPRLHSKALKELVRGVTQEGYLIDREYFLQIYDNISNKKALKIQHADEYLSSMLPSNTLSFEFYQKYALGGGKEQIPLALYSFFMQFVESLSLPSLEVYELLQLATFWEGSFQELLSLKNLI